MTDAQPNPPPLTVAASLAAIQGVTLLVLAGVEVASTNSDRASMGVTTAVFFALYGVVLVGAAIALTRRQGWARGPVLMTQLVQLGLAWNLREYTLVAVTMAVAAVLVIAGMLSAASLRALSDNPDEAT